MAIPNPSGEVDRLVGIIGALREHCLWTAQLTHASLVEYLVEESYELLECIEGDGGDGELRGELADVLLQVVLHSAIAAERGAFDFNDVAAALSAKMIRRNTHVFHPDGTLRGSYPQSVAEIIASWDAAKRAEHPQRTTPFEGLPRHLPALALATKAIDRAARWREASPEGAASPAASGSAADGGGDRAAARSEEELGEQLLGIVRRAHRDGLDAERALRSAVVRMAENWAGEPGATRGAATPQ